MKRNAELQDAVTVSKPSGVSRFLNLVGFLANQDASNARILRGEA